MEKDLDSKLRIQNNSSHDPPKADAHNNSSHDVNVDVHKQHIQNNSSHDDARKLQNNSPQDAKADAHKPKNFTFRAPQEHFNIQDFELGKIYGVGSYSKVKFSLLFNYFWLPSSCLRSLIDMIILRAEFI